MEERLSSAVEKLSRFVEQIQILDPGSQPGTFNQTEWLRWFNGEYFQRDQAAVEVLEAFAGSVTRAQIAELASQARTSDYSVESLKKVWIASYVWGGGPGATGYRARVNARLAIFDARFAASVSASVKHLSQGKLAQAHQEIDQVVGAGEGFFTKFLYFVSGQDLCNPRPLILDSQVDAALVVLLGKGWWRIVAPGATNRGDTYEAYTRTMHSWAERLSCTPEQLELFLFSQRRRLDV